MKTRLLIIIVVALTLSLSFSQSFSETIHTFEYSKIGCDMSAIDQIQSVLEEKEWIKTTLDECVKRGLITPELVELGATVWGHSTRDLSYVYGLTHGDIEKTIQLLQDPNYPINVFGSPYKQVSIGIEPENVLCQDNLELIFKLKDNSPACVKPKSIPKLIERGWGISNNWIKISNAERVLNYELDMGKIISIHAFSEHKNPSLQEEIKQTWLKINLESKQNGSLKITLPRNLIDSKIEHTDDGFFVLLDGTETEYQETKTDSERILNFSIPAKTNIVEILGYGYYNPELNQISSNSSESKILNDVEMTLSITPQKTHYLNNETIHVVGHIDNKSLGYSVGITAVDWKNNIVKQDHVELDHKGNFNLSYTISEFCKSGKYYIILDDYQSGKTKTVYFDVQYTQTKSIYPECKDGELLNCGVCKRVIP